MALNAHRKVLRCIWYISYKTRHEPRVRDACHVDEGQTQAHLGRLALRGALCGLNPPVLDAEFPPHQLLVVLGESVGESGMSPQQES